MGPAYNVSVDEVILTYVGRPAETFRATNELVRAML